jgi:hypothetical protein
MEQVKENRKLLLATDFRPHTHEYFAFAQVRATPTGSGTIDVGGALVCVFETTWGDGFFPVFRDLDERGRLARIRVGLQTEESERAMEAVDG